MRKDGTSSFPLLKSGSFHDAFTRNNKHKTLVKVSINQRLQLVKRLFSQEGTVLDGWIPSCIVNGPQLVAMLVSMMVAWMSFPASKHSHSFSHE